MPVLLLPRLLDRLSNMVETPGLWACHGNLFSGPERTGTAPYVTRSVFRRYKGCHGGVPRMPLVWAGRSGGASTRVRCMHRSAAARCYPTDQGRAQAYLAEHPG